jgi:hypothetical protein
LQERKKDGQTDRQMMLCDSLSNVGTKQQIPLPLCTESEVAFFVCCLLVVVTLVFRVSEAATLVRAAIAASAFLRKKNKKKKRERAELREKKQQQQKGRAELRETKQKTLSKRWWFWNARRLTVRFLLPPNYVCMYVCMYVYVRVCMSICMYPWIDLCVSTFFWGVKFGLNPQRKYTREYPVSIFLIF